MSEENNMCEYCNCNREAIVFDEETKAWVCAEHSYIMQDSTGYCSQSCMLGYGCDGSC